MNDVDLGVISFMLLMAISLISGSVYSRLIRVSKQGGIKK